MGRSDRAGQPLETPTSSGVATLPPGWAKKLSKEFDKSYWSELMTFVEGERGTFDVYPPASLVFRALELCDYESTRVVILGQDPYHGPGQADGLSFSVPRDLAKKPPSLLNILQVLKSDVGVELPNGNLEVWGRQGVLLLNTSLTVRRGDAGSHQRRGWETFTDSIISALNDRSERVVFILWGKPAQKKIPLITNPLHKVITSAHPSPLSARRWGFFDSKPFSQANALLTEKGLPAIDWSGEGLH